MIDSADQISFRYENDEIARENANKIIFGDDFNDNDDNFQDGYFLA